MFQYAIAYPHIKCKKVTQLVLTLLSGDWIFYLCHYSDSMRARQKAFEILAVILAKIEICTNSSANAQLNLDAC